MIYYGPLSSPYMVTRLNRFMAESSNQPHFKSPLPVRISQLQRHSPTISQEQLSDGSGLPSPRMGLIEVEDLSREQEEDFLVLLWQAYHCIYPIISEEEFRAYYDSLWAGTNGQTPRQSSALVDSMLAVSMQYGSTFLSDDEQMVDGVPESKASHFTTAAHAFYRRSQRALMETLEYPSIPSLQSHLYCIIYLYNIANLDTAHAVLALAIRLAQMLRLHIRPLGPVPQATQELYCRIWWTLYQLDSQISMILGRPPLIDPDEVGCAIPSDTVQMSATVLVSPPEEGITWLSFHVQYIRLTAVARGIHAAFSARCAETLQTKEFQDIHEDPSTLELLGTFMGNEIRAMYDWVQTVPRALKNQRQGSGEAFSTDRTPLNLNPASPLWLQRQRLLLEMTFHHLQLSILRTFIRFPPRGASLTPLSDGHGIVALNHAVVLTNILSQVLSETDLLSGLTPALLYQWDATVCILAFVLANPVCPPTPAARKILPAAFRNLDILGQSFGPITNFIQVAWEQFRSSRTPRGWSQLTTPPSQTISKTATQPSSTTSPPNGVASAGVPVTVPGMKPSTSQPTDPFSGLLTPSMLASGMMLGNDFSDTVTIDPLLDLIDTSFNLPSDLLMRTNTRWMSNGTITFNSWEGYET